MIVLRSSFYSEKESSPLKDIPRRTSGLSKKSILIPSFGELTGRRVGMDVADELDSEGKGEMEIIDKSSKEAKKAGRVVGGTIGTGIGLVSGLGVRKTMKKASKQIKNPEKVREFLEKFDVTAGKFKEGGTINKLSKKVRGRIEKAAKNSTKTSKILKKAATPAAIGLTALGAYGGMRSGGKRAEKAAKRGNTDRLLKRYNKDKNK